MALGSTRGWLLKAVLSEGLTLVGVGLLIGLGASLALTRVLATLLFETSPTDPTTLALVSLVFLASGALACLGPAWRATTVDPMRALRTE